MTLRPRLLPVDVATTYAGRCVMVTGAGGSIGSHLVRRLLTMRPQRIVLFDISEAALHARMMTLGDLAGRAGIELVAVLGSVADHAQVQRALLRHGVQIIFHAAAYKHVHLVEGNARAALANNVLGTRVLAGAAEGCGVNRLILVSSDKAVFPANVMGASKRLSELIIQDFASRSGGTVHAIARFGNVLGSSGSVLPIFRRQVRRGGPLTVTDPDATRYFMRMRDAVTRLLSVGHIARGGEIFVFDMGPPVRIGDLARRVIMDAGLRARDSLTPDGEIAIRVIGLRPGEKRHESLTVSGRMRPTACAGIFTADDPRLCEFDLAAMLRAVRRLVEGNDGEEVLTALRPWIEGAADDTTYGSRLITRADARTGVRTEAMTEG